MRISGVIASALVTVAAPLPAQTVDAARPASLVAALQAGGYKAALEKDNEGDPLIRSAANGANFVLYFYGCEKNADCQSVQFAASYTVKVKPTAAKMEEWNSKNRFSAAHLDSDGDPRITWDVVLVGGIPQKTFQEAVDRWTSVMGSFQTFVGW